MSKKAEGFSLRFVLINTGNISRKVLSKVLRSFDKNFERLHYYISDWDRLYWWGKIEDVEITEEIDIWLNMLVKEYEMILKGKEQETENAFVDHIFNTMEYLNSFYGRIYLFKEFYNALLNNSHEVRYQAILDLLDKFGEKNKEIGRVYQKYGNKEWCILSKNLKCNRGRMEIKRIIGVMANKELRKKYFGF